MKVFLFLFLDKLKLVFGGRIKEEDKEEYVAFGFTTANQQGW